MSNRVNTIIVPIYRRYWLWNAWQTDQAAAASIKQPIKTWRDGKTLEERFSYLGDQITRKLLDRLMIEWQKLESAKEGTLKNRGYRLAQAVLSREDPKERFLKSVPSDSAELHIIYPDLYSEKLVRRRLRLIAHSGRAFHRNRLFLWSLALIPQLPLMLTPLPNITVYYTIYRIWSHSRALQGTKSLEKGFAIIESQQLQFLRDELLRFQAATGVIFPKESWPARLIRKERKYLDIFDRLLTLQKQRRLEALLSGQEESVPTAGDILNPPLFSASTPQPATTHTDTTKIKSDKSHAREGVEDQSHTPARVSAHPYIKIDPSQHLASLDRVAPSSTGTGMKLVFVSDTMLTTLTDPEQRSKNPLSDENAVAIGKRWSIPHFLEHVAQARKKAIGSMFYTDIRTQMERS